MNQETAFDIFQGKMIDDCNTAIKDCDQVKDSKFKALLKAILDTFNVLKTGEVSFEFDWKKSASAELKNNRSKETRCPKRNAFLKQSFKEIQEVKEIVKTEGTDAENKAIEAIEIFLENFKTGVVTTYETSLNTLQKIVTHELVSKN